MALPTDLVTANISSDPLQFPLHRYITQNDPAAEKFVVDRITTLFGNAIIGDVVVLVDLSVIRHDAVQEVNDLLGRTGFPVYATPMGKTIIDETYERYGGVRV